MELNIDEFDKWLKAYGSAWQSGDAEAIVEIFSDDAKYYETPFDNPMVGSDRIRHYWREGAEASQSNVHFTYEIMAALENKGLAQWQATFTRVPSGNHVELNGFLVAEFDNAGKCNVFREWWHRQEKEGKGECL